MAHIALADFVERLNDLMPEVMRGFTRSESSGLIKSKLTLAQFFVLNHLLKEQICKMKDVAVFLSVSTAAATGIVERLVKYGYVQRIYEPRDRRIIKIKLTARGLELVKKACQDKKQRIREVFGQLSDIEREQYLAILKHINEILKQEKDV